jgi:hypothetical protein
MWREGRDISDVTLVCGDEDGWRDKRILPQGWKMIFREMQLKDLGEIRFEEAASRVIGKVMYCRVEVGSLLDYLLFRNVCWHYCWFWIYKFNFVNV